jgi:hypothetical protein
MNAFFTGCSGRNDSVLRNIDGRWRAVLGFDATLQPSTGMRSSPLADETSIRRRAESSRLGGSASRGCRRRVDSRDPPDPGEGHRYSSPRSRFACGRRTPCACSGVGPTVTATKRNPETGREERVVLNRTPRRRDVQITIRDGNVPL